MSGIENYTTELRVNSRLAYPEGSFIYQNKPIVFQ
jgi:hypothetical protein